MPVSSRGSGGGGGKGRRSAASAAAAASSSAAAAAAAGSTLISAGLPAPLSGAVEAWSEFADGKVSNVMKASGFVRFALRLDAESGQRVVEPRHYVIDFPLREHGRPKHQSALFTLRIVREEEIPRDPNVQGAVANHLRFKSPTERRKIPGADEYVEFELLSREHEVPSQQPLRISMGPVRADKATGQQEFIRVDMGQCIQRIATDVLEDPRGGPRILQNRWWMCIETLRLLCTVDHIDCAALDKTGVPPQEWVIRLMDTDAPINKKEEVKAVKEDRDIDDLMEFIDNRGPGRGASSAAAKGKPKKKKAGRDKEALGANGHAQQLSTGDFAAEAASPPAPPKEPSPRADSATFAPPRPVDDELPATPEMAPQRSPATSQDAVDVDLMAELLARYKRFQERSSRAETDAKVAVVRELLEVLDELENADAEIEEDTPASRVIFSAARKFEAKLQTMGFLRTKALGKRFDSTLHRAVGSVPENVATSSQVVVEELESGWVFGKDVVRPALVTLG